MSKHGKVLVAMSGGIDSSVTAILLKEQGYEVIGLTMKTWDYESSGSKNKETGCCSLDSINDARNIAVDLGFHHNILDIRSEFGDYVIDYFTDEYMLGRTPNPCVLCNTHIKWEALLKRADKLGCEYIATGHYAKIKHQGDHTLLMRAKDLNKDQTYFLHEVSGKEFAKCIFPLEGLNKNEVREIAKKNNFINHNKKDSVGICFVGERNLKDFLKRFIKFENGNIKDSEGNIVGTHPGALLFTQGQRQGLNVGGVKDKPELPWYVYDKSIKLNEVYVCQGEFNNLLMSDGLLMEEMKWINKEMKLDKLDCEVQVRHRGKPVKCTAHFLEKGVEVLFSEKIRAIAPGQSAVLYKNNECLGGGIIAKALKD